MEIAIDDEKINVINNEKNKCIHFLKKTQKTQKNNEFTNLKEYLKEIYNNRELDANEREIIELEIKTLNEYLK